jgi:hypothetical protein
MCKWQRVIPRHKRSPRYQIAHGWKDEFGSFNLGTLKFLKHFREPGSSLYFIFISYILIYIYFFSHIFFILTFLLFFPFFLSFFICSPWTLKLHCTYLLPMLRRLLVLGQRGDRDKVGTRNIFLWRDTWKYSILASTCNLPCIDDPFSTIGCGQGGNHKRWYLFLRVDIQRGLWDLQCGDTRCTDRKASKMIDTQKRNYQLLSLGPEKSRPEIIHPKINLVYYVFALKYIYDSW